MNQASRLWAQAGKVTSISELECAENSKVEKNLFETGGVRVTVGRNGTEIRWLMQSPCIASLFAVTHWLPQANFPVVLRFHASGWFEEFYEDANAVIDRIEGVIAHGDRHFPVRTFVKQVEPSRSIVATLLIDILENQKIAEVYSVECEYNKYNDRFSVEHIGSRSPIARFYGTFTNSFPCTVASYGDQVSAGYRAVLETGRPRVDHVLAAFRLPDKQVHWVPYHRLILPVLETGKSNRVRVVSQIAPVAFQVI